MKHGGVYTVGVILTRLLAFVMIPVYTRVLTPSDYGVLEMLALTSDVLGMLAGMGISAAVMRQYYGVATEVERNAVASTAASLLLAVFAVVGVVGWLAAPALSTLVLGPGQPPSFMRLSLVSLALGSTIEVPLTVLRAQQRSGRVVFVGLARLVLSLSLNITFLVWLRLGVVGVLYSSVITAATVGATLTWQLYRRAGVRFDSRIAAPLVAFGAPMVVWNLGSFVLHYSDRYFLRVHESLDSVGLYSLGYKLAMLISMFVAGPFAEIWIPKALEIERREGAGAGPVLASILRLYNFVLVAVALGIALFADAAVRLVAGPRFRDAAAVVPALCLAMVFFSYRQIGQIGALVRGRSDRIAVPTTLAAALTTGLNFVLIPSYGTYGAAWATAVAFGAEFLLMWHLSQRLFRLPLALREIGAPAVVALAVWGVSWAIVSSDWAYPVQLIAQALCFVAYFVLCRVGGLLPTELRTAVASALRNPRHALHQLRSA